MGIRCREEGVPLERLCKKLKSSQGASILMALLFLLVCMMVASSLLMAAVSNAGKIQSDRTEQQKYLTLSSALRLVCGELEKLEYTGQYQHDEWSVVTEEKNDKGEVIDTKKTDYYWCGQKEGTLTGGSLADALRGFFLEELDGMYGEAFTARGFPAQPAQTPKEHTLVLKVEDSGLPGLEEPVTVMLRMENGGKLLHLTAALGSADEKGYVYTLEAELASAGVPQEVEYMPHSGAVFASAPSGTPVFTEKIQWKLTWIEKKGAA